MLVRDNQEGPGSRISSGATGWKRTIPALILLDEDLLLPVSVGAVIIAESDGHCRRLEEVDSELCSWLDGKAEFSIGNLFLADQPRACLSALFLSEHILQVTAEHHALARGLALESGGHFFLIPNEGIVGVSRSEGQ